MTEERCFVFSACGARVCGRQVNADRGLYKEYLQRAESEAVAQLQVGWTRRWEKFCREETCLFESE